MIIRKISPLFSSITKFAFSSSPAYPYKFGGLPQQKCERSPHCQFLMKQHFDFKTAYFSVLAGLQDNDEEFLKQFMQKKLIENINFVDVSLIHQESSHQYGLIQSYIIIGTKFERTQQSRKIILDKKVENSFKMYLSSGLSEMKKFSLNINSLQFPFVFGTEFFVGSQAKLVRKQDQKNKNNRKQYHTIHFEVEHTLKFKDLNRLMTQTHNQSQTLKKILLDPLRDKEWKVADMDRVLDGNIQKGPVSLNNMMF